MQNSNYVILIDENGQPYLAHSIWDRAKSAYGSARSAGNRAVKYIEKIGDGAKARYFYTQDELKAYYNKGKNAAKNAANKASQSVKDAVGITARNKANAALDNALAAQSKYLSAAKDKNGRYKGSAYQAEYAVSEAQRQKENLDRVKAEQTEYLKKHPIMSTKKAHEQMRQVKDAETAAINASRDAGRAQERAAKDQKAFSEATQAMDRAVEEYSKTPLSVIDDDYRSRFFDNMAETAKETVEEAVDKAKEKIGLDARANVEDAEIASGAATHNRLLAYERFQKASKDLDEAHAAYKENPKDKSLRDKYDQAREELHEASLNLDEKRNADNNAERALGNAKASYATTPLGKAENAVNTVKEKASEVKEITASQARKLQEKLASGKELARDELSQLMSFLLKGYK